MYISQIRRHFADRVVEPIRDIKLGNNTSVTQHYRSAGHLLRHLPVIGWFSYRGDEITRLYREQELLFVLGSFAPPLRLTLLLSSLHLTPSFYLHPYSSSLTLSSTTPHHRFLPNIFTLYPHCITPRTSTLHWHAPSINTTPRRTTTYNSTYISTDNFPAPRTRNHMSTHSRQSTPPHITNVHSHIYAHIYTHDNY